MNGINIEKGRLAQLFRRVKAACEKLVAQGMAHPTRFEVETAAAFLWFYEENCDMALLEVGMGGATDATNLIKKPLVSVLTSISMDHIRFLGNSLAEDRNCKKRHNQSTGAGGLPCSKSRRQWRSLRRKQKKCRQS